MKSGGGYKWNVADDKRGLVGLQSKTWWTAGGARTGFTRGFFGVENHMEGSMLRWRVLCDRKVKGSETFLVAPSFVSGRRCFHHALQDAKYADEGWTSCGVFRPNLHFKKPSCVPRASGVHMRRLFGPQDPTG